MSVAIKWIRQGTVERPRYVGGAVVNGTVAVVSDSDLNDAIRQAWNQFQSAVLPLSGQTGWDVIRWHMNFSAGGLTIDSAFSGELKREGLGAVYLVTGNFADLWNRAVSLDDGVAGRAFREVIEEGQDALARRILTVVRNGTSRLDGLLVVFTCVGTQRVLWATIGAKAASEAPPQVAKRAPRSTESDRITWKLASDLPGNILYIGVANEQVRKSQLRGGLVEMWEIFSTRVLPLNKRETWDHIRCELMPNHGYLAVYVAHEPVERRVDQGRCHLEMVELSELWDRFDATGDSVELRKSLIRLVDEIVSSARTLTECSPQHPLRGLRIVFLYLDDEEFAEAVLGDSWGGPTGGKM